MSSRGYWHITSLFVVIAKPGPAGQCLLGKDALLWLADISAALLMLFITNVELLRFFFFMICYTCMVWVFLFKVLLK